MRTNPNTAPTIKVEPNAQDNGVVSAEIFDDITLLNVIDNETIGLSVRLIDFYQFLHPTNNPNDVYNWFNRKRKLDDFKFVANKDYTTGRISLSLNVAIKLTKFQLSKGKLTKTRANDIINHLKSFKTVVPQEKTVAPQEIEQAPRNYEFFAKHEDIISNENPTMLVKHKDIIESEVSTSPNIQNNVKDSKHEFLRELLKLLDSNILFGAAKGLHDFQNALVCAIPYMKDYYDGIEQLSNLNHFIMGFQKLLMSDNVENWNDVNIMKYLSFENSNVLQAKLNKQLAINTELEKTNDFLQKSYHSLNQQIKALSEQKDFYFNLAKEKHE